MRCSILAVAVLLSSLCFADEWKKDYKVGATPQLQVETNDAGIEVHGAAVSSISARVTATGWKIGPGEVRITERQAGDAVYLEVKIPNRHFVLNFGNHSLHIDVTVPQATRVQLHSADGSLKLSGTKGEARLNTSDGAIRVQGLEGPLHARSADGSIEVSGRFDDLDLSTADGHIGADIWRGSTMHGNWSVRTSDGSINLRLPPDLHADLDAWTSDGHIAVNVPVLVQGTQGRNRVRGKLNGGGQLLEVHTSDGSIHIGSL